ncbi:MAG: GNAT family N-acetyltransferase [Bdellovibrionaceae bacterium]|nr:GNAT family N-acetyltransferase [Pseudobdellovibrionaceae bacterium]
MGSRFHTAEGELNLIRPARPQDVSQILSFIRELAVYEKLEHEVVATEESLRATLFSDKPAAEVVFIEDNGIPVGFALYFTSYSTFLGKPGLYLEDLYVKPEARGRGYGKKLLAYLAKEVVRRNYGRLEWSVLDWNLPSIEFYESLGAEPLADWIRYRLTEAPLKRLAESV